MRQKCPGKLTPERPPCLSFVCSLAVDSFATFPDLELDSNDVELSPVLQSVSMLKEVEPVGSLWLGAAAVTVG